MKNIKITALVNRVFQKLQGCMPAAKEYFSAQLFKREFGILKSVYALLLDMALVKLRSVFSSACSKKMTTFVIGNAIYVISLRLEPTSNIHLNQ